MSETKQPYLSVHDLEVIYTSEESVIHAVNGVSLDVNKGETLGLVGETGAGKTTIAKSILRILPDPPAKLKGGQIFLDGEDLLKKEEKEMLQIRGNKIAMIFQDPMTALNPLQTAGDQIAEGLILHNSMSRAEAKAEAERMLELVGIPKKRYSEYPFEFSGGMKQRVVIAMALSCRPELLLADEPTTALDVTIQAEVLELINELKKQYDMAMILITHDLGVVAQTCDRVAVVYAGQIIEYGSREDIFLHAAHPYTHGLFSSLPKMDDDAERLTPIAGMPPDPSDLPRGCTFHPRCPDREHRCMRESIPLSEISPGHFCRCCTFRRKGGKQ